jgi:Flp pilus assembly protein TadG
MADVEDRAATGASTGASVGRGDEEARVLRERRAAAESGAAAVEFALVMPLLFIVIFGIIQYGYGFFQMQAAQATVSEAVRQAALGFDTCGEWDAAVQDAAEGNGMAFPAIGSMTLDFENDLGTDTTAERGDRVTAAVTYTPSLDFPLVPFPGSITRTARTTVQDIGELTSDCG